MKHFHLRLLNKYNGITLNLKFAFFFFVEKFVYDKEKDKIDSF